MKNNLIAILLVASVFSVSAQIPREAFDLTNSLDDLWRTSPKEKAVEASVKLNKLYQPFYIENIHNMLSQSLKDQRDKGYAQAYLQAMWDLQDPSIRSIIEPMYVWNQSFDVKSLKEAEGLLESFQDILKDSTDRKAKTELYGLLILKNLENKKLVPEELQKKVLNKIIGNLKKYPYLDQPLSNQVVPRAWHRYLLAYSMYLKFRTQGEQSEDLQAASNYSPDLTDMQRRDAYNYDAYLLEGDNRNVGFQTKFIQYLDKNSRFSEELKALLETTFAVPLNGNMQRLKTFLGLHTEFGEFKALWSTYVKSQMKQAPALQVAYDNDVLDFTKSRTSWTFIDVWGTWCSPCVKELPHLNEVANKYNSLADSKVRIRTFSYQSTKLKAFMETNNYTFPVAEIGVEVTTPLGINSYPTKLLISPDNKFLIIPFNVNWEEYMRNYTLFE
jgi:thiol-disulfide isomerase/thioredoxin